MRSDRHADADLGGALRHGVRQHSINTDGGEQPREGGKQNGRQRDKAAFGKRAHHHPRSRLDQRDGYVFLTIPTCLRAAAATPATPPPVRMTMAILGLGASSEGK